MRVYLEDDMFEGKGRGAIILQHLSAEVHTFHNAYVRDLTILRAKFMTPVVA